MTEKISSVTTKFLRFSATKAQKYVNQIKGKSYKEALIILEKLPQKTSFRIWQTLKSAGANAVHNFSLKKDDLVIKDIYLNRGNILKRVHARARGKGYKIEKKFSHLTISLKTIK